MRFYSFRMTTVSCLKGIYLIIAGLCEFLLSMTRQASKRRRMGEQHFQTMQLSLLHTEDIGYSGRMSSWHQFNYISCYKRVVTHGQQQYVVTYYMHKTTPANVYTSYVPCNYEHLLTGPFSCHNMNNQQ